MYRYILTDNNFSNFNLTQSQFFALPFSLSPLQLQINCEVGEFCPLAGTFVLQATSFKKVIEDYLDHSPTQVSGFGTIDGFEVLQLPDLQIPKLSNISFTNLTSFMDEDCDAYSGLCFFDGFARIEEFHILGATINGGDITVPCVFGEGFCPDITPAEIQALDATTGAMAVNITLNFDEYLPFLKNLRVDLPAIGIDLDLSGKDSSVSTRVEPFVLTNDKNFHHIVYVTGAINDWSAILRTAYTLADETASITVQGQRSVIASNPSSFSSVIPEITFDLHSSDYDFEFPDLPLPYTSLDPDYTAKPWQLVKTNSEGAKFRVEMDFENPVPVAFKMSGMKGAVMFANPISNDEVEIASLIFPNEEFLLTKGNNSLLTHFTLNADAPTCKKTECNEKMTTEEQIACVPCTAVNFLRSFLATEPTDLTVAMQFRSILDETVKIFVPLRMYDESYSSKIDQGRSPDFIDTIVNVDSILSRAVFFELDFSETVAAVSIYLIIRLLVGP